MRKPKKGEPKFEVGNLGGQVYARFPDGGSIEGDGNVTDLLLLAILRELEAARSRP
jgi:hypothetical protein